MLALNKTIAMEYNLYEWILVTCLGKNAVVSELNPGQEWIFRYVILIVVRKNAIFNASQHVRANNGIMSVRTNFALANIFENGIGKRITHGIDENIRLVLYQSLHS